MSDRILCIDDDPNVLEALRRQLRQRFNITTADRPEQALQLLRDQGPFAVVLADQHMPGIQGIELIEQARRIDGDLVCMMLTGNADLRTAIEAVNKGAIFRFLTKPCPSDQLVASLEAALQQYRLVQAERELLNQTLSGGIRLLCDVLSMTQAETFGQARALRQMAREVCSGLGFEQPWTVEMAAMLARIGMVALPPEVAVRARDRIGLRAVEKNMLESVPQIGHDLLRHIPRLEPVAQIVLYHTKCFDGSGFPHDEITGVDIPEGARILKILYDQTELISNGQDPVEALETMQPSNGKYDPDLLARITEHFRRTPATGAAGRIISVHLAGLHAGQTLVDDLTTRDNRLLVSSGHRLTETMLARIHNYAQLAKLHQPIRVRQPDHPDSRETLPVSETAAPSAPIRTADATDPHGMEEEPTI